VKLMLHTCCGPCAIYPVQRLRASGITVHGYFYRDNIHPYSECCRREEALVSYAQTIDLPIIVPKEYDLDGFLRKAVFREADRCRICYHSRLTATARIAARGRFDAFSSTLLYSRYQAHDVIREVGEAIGREMDIPFYYDDFRIGWKDGIAASKRLGMYRQSYCGCIYSERDRHYSPHRPNASFQAD